MENLLSALLVVMQILTVVLGLIVLFRNWRNKINRTFAILSFLYAFWVFCGFMCDSAVTDGSALFWAKAAIVGPILLGPFTYYFAHYFPNAKKKISYSIRAFLFVVPVALLLFVTSKYNVVSVTRKGWGTDFVPGSLYYALFIYLVLFYGSALYVFINKIRNSQKASERKQIFYIFMATVLTLTIGLVTNLILPTIGYGIFSKLGPSTAILFFVAFVAYAIAMESLFEIRVIFLELLASFIAIVAILDLLTSHKGDINILRIFMTIFLLFLLGMFVKNVMSEIRRKEELEVANAKLLKLDKSKSEFISIASHQLRTPLTSMKGFISIMKNGSYGKLPRKLEEPIHHIEIANERLISLVKNMLDISRIEAGGMAFEFKNGNINELVNELYHSFLHIANEKGNSLELKIDNDLPAVKMDRGKIRELLSNLIDNAIEYTEKGHIKIETRKKRGNVQILVSDTGIGIPKGEISCIFDKFSRGKKARQIKKNGSGLGLYLGKKIVEAHGGKIYARSKGSSKGSTFFVELPLE